MRHYCTLFDSKYLAQGLVLYESLKKHSSEEFMLWILCMDEDVYQVLHSMPELNITIVKLATFEHDGDLSQIRKDRSWKEYCWSLASIFTDALRTADVRGMREIDELTYLDADLMFFSDPKVIFDEIGERSIAVIPHRLAENRDKARLSQNGKFNVSWVTFKNNAIGRECLSRWAAQCRERCSADSAGDQLYLDEWPIRYGEECAIIKNIGAGVAPWNLSSYSLANYRLMDAPQVDGCPIVFYHYHEWRMSEDGTILFTNYKLRQEDKRIIYEPYVSMVKSQLKRIADIRASNASLASSMQSQNA